MNLKTDIKWPKDLKMKKKDSWNMSKKLESEGTERRRSKKNWALRIHSTLSGHKMPEYLKNGRKKHGKCP